MSTGVRSIRTAGWAVAEQVLRVLDGFDGLQAWPVGHVVVDSVPYRLGWLLVLSRWMSPLRYVRR
jgi:hypothetical protein